MQFVLTLGWSIFLAFFLKRYLFFSKSSLEYIGLEIYSEPIKGRPYAGSSKVSSLKKKKIHVVSITLENSPHLS